MNRLINTIKEEIFRFLKEYNRDDEPSIADKWYEKKLGIRSKKISNEITDDDGELMGMIFYNTKGNKFKDHLYVFKNPRNINNFDYEVKGILLNNGDFYLMMGDINMLHEDLIDFLIRKGILPSSVSKNYPNDYPEEYVAVERYGSSNIFIPSSLYWSFPKYYREMFDTQNSKRGSYKFKKSLSKEEEELYEQLDMNRAYSYHPKGLDPNRNFGRPF